MKFHVNLRNEENVRQKKKENNHIPFSKKLELFKINLQLKYWGLDGAFNGSPPMPVRLKGDPIIFKAPDPDLELDFYRPDFNTWLSTMFSQVKRRLAMAGLALVALTAVAGSTAPKQAVASKDIPTIEKLGESMGKSNSPVITGCDYQGLLEELSQVSGDSVRASNGVFIIARAHTNTTNPHSNGHTNHTNNIHTNNVTDHTNTNHTNNPTDHTNSSHSDNAPWTNFDPEHENSPWINWPPHTNTYHTNVAPGSVEADYIY